MTPELAAATGVEPMRSKRGKAGASGGTPGEEALLHPPVRWRARYEV
jgi:hypothetical protein